MRVTSRIAVALLVCACTLPLGAQEQRPVPTGDLGTQAGADARVAGDNCVSVLSDP